MKTFRMADVEKIEEMLAAGNSGSRVERWSNRRNEHRDR